MGKSRRKRHRSKTVPFYIKSYLGDAQVVVGLDEVGWGSIAGPLVVSACALPHPYKGPRLRDSKKYSTHKKRCEVRDFIHDHSLDYSIVSFSAEEIARLGPQETLESAQRLAVNRLLSDKDWTSVKVVTDGKNLVKGLDYTHKCLIGGDDLIPAISAASVLAKTHRDDYMLAVADTYPGFTFYKHKGYATTAHIEELRRNGITREHRLNVSIVQDVLEQVGEYDYSEDRLRP